MKRIEVVAAIIHDNSRIFATQRGYGEHKDKWEFPGGKVEPGETPEDALIREIKEELATELEIEKFLHTVDYDYPTFHLIMHCYLCKVKSGKLELLEHEAAKWVTERELESVDWLPPDEILIKKLQQESNQMKQSLTLSYYNKNAQSFVEHTISVDFKETQDRFLKFLPPAPVILDFGCGSGRDTKYFLEKGCHVTAIDGSLELCRRAGEYTGIPVKQQLFQELSDRDVYDGIWACSSILHLPLDELKEVVQKMRTALKENGIIYTSFKYGTFEGERNGRYFTDMTEERFRTFLESVGGLALEEQWITSDVRPQRGDEKWLNVILRRIEIRKNIR